MPSVARIVSFAVAVLLLGAGVMASEVVPISYTAPPGDPSWSWWYYSDETGQQLTDGIHGPPWSGEPGFPGENEETWRMYDWVAWDSHPVSLVFDLPSSSLLSRIDLYTGRATTASIFIPHSVTIAALASSGEWTTVTVRDYDDTQFTDASRHTLTIHIEPVAASRIKVDLVPTARWVFLDEVDFFSEPVPEPSSLLSLLCGLGGIGGVMWRRKR